MGTILSLKIKQTLGDGSPIALSHDDRIRSEWNLWHPTDFAVEYGELIRKVDTIMSRQGEMDWKVFVGNVPLVTIAPLAKGVGDTITIESKGTYYKYYTYFPFEEEFAVKTGMHLNLNQALHIDDCIREYNKIIASTIESYNSAHGTQRYFMVDMCDALERMAWKRNSSQPTYEFPEYFRFIYPQVDTKYYHADRDGQLKQGGIFSLDGVHPTAIGQGLVATEFMKVMLQAGVDEAEPFTDHEWREIFKQDTLYSRPISLMGEVYEHSGLAEFILKVVKAFKD